MDARVILSDELKHQESNTTKILKWLQDHPNACKNTSTGTLARIMSHEFSTTSSLASTLGRMVKANAIQRVGSNKKADYTINYLHQWVLPEVRERASEADKKHIKEVMEKVSADTKLTDEGCLVTKNTTDIPPETEQSIVVPVEVHTDTTNGSKNITITLNLNLSI